MPNRRVQWLVEMMLRDGVHRSLTRAMMTGVSKKIRKRALKEYNVLVARGL